MPDGCRTSPVGYIEGWYVDADLRQHGLGGQLVASGGAVGECARLPGDGLRLLNSTIDVSFHAHLALERTTCSFGNRSQLKCVEVTDSVKIIQHCSKCAAVARWY